MSKENLQEALVHNLLNEEKDYDTIKDYSNRVKQSVNSETEEKFNYLKEVIEDGSNKVEFDGFYFPEEAVYIINGGDLNQNLNKYMNLTTSNILNDIEEFDSIDDVIDNYFEEYLPDSAFTWATNFVDVLNSVDINSYQEALEEVDDEDYEEFEEGKKLEEANWCGIEGIEHIWNGAWSDPQIKYNGHIYNEWDVQDYIGDTFNAEMEEEGIDVTDNDWHVRFAEWCKENPETVKALLDDLEPDDFEDNLGKAKVVTIEGPIADYIDITEDREQWDYPMEDIDEAINNNEFIVISKADDRAYEVTEVEFNLIKDNKKTLEEVKLEELPETDGEKYKNYLKDTLEDGKIIIISNDAKNYTPTKFLIDNGKVYYNNKEISFGWEEHPSMKTMEDLIEHIIKMEEEGCTIAAQDRTGKEIKEEAKEDGILKGDETYVAKNQFNYNTLGLIIDNAGKRFQLLNGQAMPLNKHKKMSAKAIREKAKQLQAIGYDEFDGYASVKLESKEPENESTEDIIQSYMNRMSYETKTLDDVKVIVKEMCKDNRIEDKDLDWLFEHSVEPVLKERFNIDVPYEAEKLNIGTYEYIMRRFADGEQLTEAKKYCIRFSSGEVDEELPVENIKITKIVNKGKGPKGPDDINTDEVVYIGELEDLKKFLKDEEFEDSIFDEIELYTEAVEERDLSNDLFGTEADIRKTNDQRAYEKYLELTKEIMNGENDVITLDSAKALLKNYYIKVNCLYSFEPEEIDRRIAKDLPEIFGEKQEENFFMDQMTDVAKSNIELGSTVLGGLMGAGLLASEEEKESEDKLEEANETEEFKLFVKEEDLDDVNDSSLLFDSGTTICSYSRDGYTLTMTVAGDVRIINNETGDVYKTYTQFPEELINALRTGEAWDEEKYTIDMNNWFEFFMADKNGMPIELNEVAEPEGQLNGNKVEALKEFMKEAFDDYLGQLNESKKLKTESWTQEEVNLLNKRLIESKKLQESELSDMASVLEDLKDKPEDIEKDVEGVVDGILVVVDPDIDTEGYEEVIEHAQEIIEDTPEGEIPFLEDYVGQFIQTCPICGKTFVTPSLLQQGDTCPICLEQPTNFVTVGKINSDEEVAEKLNADIEIEQDNVDEEMVEDNVEDMEEPKEEKPDNDVNVIL